MFRNSSRFLQNFSFALLSNIVGLLLSVVMSIVLPILFGNDLASYGYVQLYLLYVSYYYIFNLGFCEGIVLREGGKEYHCLDKRLYSGQLLLLLCLQVFFAVVILLYAYRHIADSNKVFVLTIVCINIVIMQMKTAVSGIMQATNRIKTYSMIILIGKLCNAATVIIAVALGVRSYRIVILSLTLGEVAALLYALYKIHDILFSRPSSLSATIRAFYKNTAAGISILLSGVSAMLMTGIVRIAIETQWGLETFAQVSLTLNLSNMFMVFITSVSIVLYPEMRRMDPQVYLPLYQKMRTALMTLLFGMMIFFVPLRSILGSILPQYRDSLSYMAILLPICIYSSKMTMLIQTYMKVLRLEKKIMLSNIVGLLLICILTAVTVFWLKNMDLAVISLLISQIIRTVCAEFMLSKHIEIRPHHDIAAELLLTALFVAANWCIGGLLGMFIYASGFSLYFIYKRSAIFSYMTKKY